jgi:hypothetical protein
MLSSLPSAADATDPVGVSRTTSFIPSVSPALRPPSRYATPSATYLILKVVRKSGCVARRASAEGSSGSVSDGTTVMSAVSSFDSAVSAGAGCVEAVEGCALTAAWVLPLVPTAVVAESPWLAGGAGVDVADTACGVGTAAGGITVVVTVAGAGAAAVAERTLEVTLPEPAELVVGPGAGAVGATCAADMLDVAIPEIGVVLLLFDAVLDAAGTANFAGAAAG